MSQRTKLITGVPELVLVPRRLAAFVTAAAAARRQAPANPGTHVPLLLAFVKLLAPRTATDSRITSASIPHVRRITARPARVGRSAQAHTVWTVTAAAPLVAWIATHATSRGMREAAIRSLLERQMEHASRLASIPSTAVCVMATGIAGVPRRVPMGFRARISTSAKPPAAQPARRATTAPGAVAWR